MGTDPIDVAIITRERRGDVIEAVRSVLSDLGSDDAVHVLENGCSQRSTEGLEDLFPTVRWHRVSENLGVAGGRNWLLEHTDRPVVAFVDDDATLQPGSLERVRRAFAGAGALGAVAFRIDDPETGTPRSHEYPFKGTAGVDDERPATYFVGAGFALRREATEEVGGFDGRLFYALEELDLSFALIEAGWRIRYLPTARVVHHASPAGRPGGQKVYFMVRNRLVVAGKWLPLRYRVSQIVMWGSLWLLRAVRARQVRHWLRGIRDGRRMATESKRSPLDRDAIAHLRAHGGRLWY
ncbi:MAG: glycosyltransferase [Acidimicrobiia bacterium]